MLSAEGIAGLVAVVWCFAAGCTDAYSSKIPNLITYSGMIAGFLIALVSPEVGAWNRLIGLLVGFALLFLFWRQRLVGGGDLKLTMMIGALKGATFCLYFLLYTLSFVVIAIVFVAVLRVGIVKTFSFMFASLFGVFFFRTTPEVPEELKEVTVPFAAFAFAAVLVCLALESRGLLLSPIPVA